MPRDNLNDLVAFVTVAREKSFTRAAAQLGVSQSALSHTIRSLESRLGMRLLTRTTRSVSATDVGERLLATLAPRFDEIYSELAALNDLRDKPSGVIRISATDYAINQLLWPKLEHFLHEYPDITVELISDYGLTDIVANRYDAGIRLGEQVTNGMISARIGPDLRFVVVGSPAYFASHPKPETPQDLLQHRCINLRLPTHGGFYVWEFAKDGREVKARVEGQVIFNSVYQIRSAAVSGFGLAHIPEDIVAPLIAEGKLIQVMDEWCPVWDGLHIYYPSRRESSRALALVVKALRAGI
ncbi:MULTISPECIES: LysR family transcriptional regulator [Rahnella]|uniref:LysR family transcriptional regulator n=1 Tax=Rahnella laticis TaxID=2787622 RepID=A0ABS0E8R1_9GAMM|nr:MULTISPECIES: LysR family transcriptional regulator [Rahnella]MBF7981487.1 LysR family transcriptional regulator [Rahnella laticis]MBF8001579.1 LysR family transcriptional regulator [Rahnella sp. LAC-M12]